MTAAARWDSAGSGSSSLDDLTDVDTTSTAPSNGDALVYDSGSSLWVPGAGGGGGGGAGWTQTVDQSGATTTAWTTVAGTWSSDAGGYLKQTDTTAAYRGLKLTAGQPVGPVLVVQAEIRIPTGAAALTRAFIAPASSVDLSGATDAWFGIQYSSGAVSRFLQRETTATLTVSGGLALDTWYTVRVTVNGPWFTWTIDGASELTHWVNGGASQADHSGLMLVSYAGSAHFRNVKAWRLDGPS